MPPQSNESVLNLQQCPSRISRFRPTGMPMQKFRLRFSTLTQTAHERGQYHHRCGTYP